MGSSITVVTRSKDTAEKAKSGSAPGGPVLEFTMDEDKYATRSAGAVIVINVCQPTYARFSLLPGILTSDWPFEFYSVFHSALDCMCTYQGTSFVTPSKRGKQ